MKKILSLGAATLLTLTAQVSAQEYHGWKINASQALIDNAYNNTLGAPAYDYNRQISLQALYQPKYSPVTVNQELTEWTHGTTTHTDAKGKFGDIASNATTHTGTQHWYVDLSLEKGMIEGAKLTSTMGDNGLAYVTIPEQYYKDGKLTDVPEEGGDIRIRFFMLSGDKGRINDAGMPHTDDINGVYLTVDAPSTVNVTAEFTQASNTSFTDANADKGTGDKLGAMGRVAVFNLPATLGNGPQDITTTQAPTNSWNLFTYKRTSDEYAFPIYAVDIVFYGVKPSQKVGWTNFQTLHEGYTPTQLFASQGIENIQQNDQQPAQYFNLQGMPVQNPTKGQLYIKRQGTTTSKILF